MQCIIVTHSYSLIASTAGEQRRPILPTYEGRKRTLKRTMERPQNTIKMLAEQKKRRQFVSGLLRASSKFIYLFLCFLEMLVAFFPTTFETTCVEHEVYAGGLPAHATEYGCPSAGTPKFRTNDPSTLAAPWQNRHKEYLLTHFNQLISECETKLTNSCNEGQHEASPTDITLKIPQKILFSLRMVAEVLCHMPPTPI